MIFPLRSGSGCLLAHVAALRPLARLRAAVVLGLSVGEGCRRLAAGRHERGGRLPHSEGVGAIKVSAAVSLFAAGVFAASLLAFLPRPTMGKGAPPAGREDEAGRLARVVELRIDDVVEPVLAEYISNGIEEAAKSDASLVLITMNTPGGLDSAMREIIQHIIRSPIPVAVYVAPSGSRAASAGFFILLSSDIAVMAPGTDTGAASPLLISILSGAPAQIDETLKRKILNEATAYLRSLTSKRGRNVELAEKAVTEAKAFSEKEALEGRLIDMIARSPEELLAQLNGRKITRFDGSTVTLDLRNPSRTAIEMTSRQRLLSYFVRPDVLFILLILGILGLYAEFTHPGMVFPGVIGGIALLLALYGMRVLPVNATGVLLIALAVLLFILEAKYTSHGVLGIGGVVAMLLGALMLVRSPLTGGGVSLGVALGVTLPFAGLTIFLMRLVLRSRGWKQAAGAEQLIGAEGEVTQAIEPPGRGLVFVSGELWRATAREPVRKGARVRVVKVDGLTLLVEPTEPASRPPG